MASCRHKDEKVIKGAIIKNYIILTENLTASEVVPFLFQEGVLSLEEKQHLDKLEEREGSIKAARQLLDYILEKKETEIQKFVESLERKQASVYHLVVRTIEGIEKGEIEIHQGGSVKGFGITGMEIFFEEILQANIKVTWKQGSFFGLGGDMCEYYNQCTYRNKAGAKFTVFVHQAMGEPKKLCLKGNVQYGMSEGSMFLVYHDKKKYTPYQQRFVESAHKKVFDTVKSVMNYDPSFLVGDYLGDFD